MDVDIIHCDTTNTEHFLSFVNFSGHVSINFNTHIDMILLHISYFKFLTSDKRLILLQSNFVIEGTNHNQLKLLVFRNSFCQLKLMFTTIFHWFITKEICKNDLTKNLLTNQNF